MATWSDNFNRANQDPLVDGKDDSATPTGTWVQRGTSPQFQISSNQAYADADVCIQRCTHALGNDQYAKAKRGSGSYHGIAVRLTTESGNHSAYYFQNYGGTYRVIKTIWGSDTVIANSLGSSSASDVMELRVTGTTLEALVNGTSKGTWTDSALASGYSAIYGYSSYLDDFECGDIVSGGSSNPLAVSGGMTPEGAIMRSMGSAKDGAETPSGAIAKAVHIIL